MEFTQLDEDQRRQYIDAEHVFKALTTAEREASAYRGSMIWREIKGYRYLIKTSPKARQKSLGRESPELRQVFEQFTKRKAQLEARARDLRDQSVRMMRLNRALRVGRTPDIIIDILNALKKAGVAEHFLLVGTNALYAYETAAGVRFPQEVLATRDADFLFDTRRRAAFLGLMGANHLSFLELLQKVDKTFERHPTDNHTAVNSKGYEVDVIRRFPLPENEAAEHPMRMTEDEHDLWAMRAPTASQLVSVSRFKQVVVGTSGAMAMMATVDPRSFAQVKRRLSQAPHRDPLKAPKDKLQAEMVEKLVAEHLPNLARQPLSGPDEDDSRSADPVPSSPW